MGSQDRPRALTGDEVPASGKRPTHDNDTMTIHPAPGRDLFVVKKGRMAHASGVLLSGRSERPDTADERAEARDQALWEERREFIRLTIANQSFDMVFQPIVDLKGGSAVGAEALSRFRHGPDRPPDVWFAEAAAVGLGVELELTALRLALEQLGRLPAGLYLSLNASIEAVMSDEFRASMNSIPAERVVLELTEHTEVHDYTLFRQTLQDLRSKGLRLAVDDAGAGYSSFRHILNLQPDVIKLDIGLTKGIDRDPARRALGSALLAFGLEAYNASVVAEGIETEGEFRTLQVLGCPLGQGYYLGRPRRLHAPELAVRPPAPIPLRFDGGATFTLPDWLRDDEESDGSAQPDVTTVRDQLFADDVNGDFAEMIALMDDLQESGGTTPTGTGALVARR
jgi:EAL domain-containing protein (putative c-di-GMP-specific phosphodiesterase class I)